MNIIRLSSTSPRRVSPLRKIVRYFCPALLALAGAASAADSSMPAALNLRQGWQLQDSAKVTESGEAISTLEFQPSGWNAATVPGTVLTSLVNDGAYPEPLFGEDNRHIPETLCRTAWWYRTAFNVAPSFAGKEVWLTFYGINYTAEVWLNGHKLGEIQGAFIRGLFDVTPYVKIGGENALAVLVKPQPHVGVTHEKTIADGTGPNGGVTGIDGPAFICSIGWDWIPTIRDRDTGIWQDVVLSATGPVVIEDPNVTSDLPLPRTDSADLTVQTTIRNVTDTEQTALLTGTIDSVSFQQSVALAPHESKLLTFTPTNATSLHIRNPRLWWPNGYGPQNLYNLHLACSVKNATSDTEDVPFGIRKITYTLPGSDNLALSVNGVPVVAKGGDWGMDEAMKRITAERLDAMLHMHQIANYTIARNWVGQSTSEYFYDACDKYGILLWDEFFEPHPADGPIPENIPLYLSNVRDKILRYRNHPCIALWCARNEGDPPPAIGEGIRKLINELDPVRLYQPSSTSGRGVNSGGPYHWRTPREYYTYTEAFKTEIGSMSVPTLEAVQAMMPSNDWETINDDWAEHDFCGGAQQGDRYPGIIAGRYGAPADLAQFVRESQLANFEAFRAMYEGRFAKLFKPETGVITWMSSPAQPSFVWQLYSHDLEPNASLYGARKACESIHAMLNESDGHLMVVNNSPNKLGGLKLKTTLCNLDGAIASSTTVTVDAAASAVTDAGALPEAKNLSDVFFVKLQLSDAKGHVRSENFYWRSATEDPDNLQPLNTLANASLQVRAVQHLNHGKCLLDVSLKNPDKTAALMAHLQLRRAKSGRRVLPVFYSDNYVSLLPGESTALKVEASVEDLDGEEPLLALDGWNVTLAAGNSPVKVVMNPSFAPRTPAAPGAKVPAPVLSINCGGGQLGFFKFGTPPVVGFSKDRDVHGGTVATVTDTITADVPNAAPAELYQSERWGACTYTIPFTPGVSCTVRLHFAELRFGPGERKFNVEINGKTVLSDFDIAAEGGKGKALVKDIPGIRVNDRGNIVIAFKAGSADQPKVCGIQIVE